MKKLFLFICVALFITTLPICATAAANVSHLSVFNFNAKNIDASKYGPEITNILTETLSKNQSFSIMGHHELLDLLRNNDLQQNTDLGNLINIGNKLGLNFIITGRIEKKGGTLTIECIVVNINAEKVTFTRNIKVSGDSNLETEVSKLSDSIAASISTGVH